MSEIITYSAQNFKRTVNYNYQFILIGNSIDGGIDTDIISFIDFKELQSKLPSILVNLEHFGEWDLKLYQVAKPYKIIKKYGYYKVPNSGRLIFEHNYMDYHINSVQFQNDNMEIIGSYMEITENWNAKSDEDFLNYEIDIAVKTIHFKNHARNPTIYTNEL
jgi:hypothetical protein